MSRFLFTTTMNFNTLFLTIIIPTIVLSNPSFEQSKYASAGILVGNCLTHGIKMRHGPFTHRDFTEIKLVNIPALVSVLMADKALSTTHTTPSSWVKCAQYFFCGVALGSSAHVPIKYTFDSDNIDAADIITPSVITGASILAAKMCALLE